MNVKKVIYTFSAICIAFAIFIAAAPRVVDFLNTHDSRVLNFLLSFSIGYIGLVSIVALRFWERKKNREAKRNKVFLIYSQEDIDKASVIKHALSNMGYDVWFSHESLLPGHVIERQMQSVLDESGAAVFLASGSGIPHYAKKEIEYILKNRSVKDNRFIPIIPVLIDGGTLPQELDDVVYVKYEDEQLMDKLDKSLTHLVKKNLVK
ncbi:MULTISPECIES: toll/interleukin-1 receptor domain-containing protein [Klebsiella pneumoniae complex]|uniref:toll/interleukin-1 receptor domain-containing protein n=1 Tax=Klebsiella variicola TaxID=244366 RepID=UPI000D75DAE8|nr:toll/interleukin-1 receptor domain-containing protein [Klebsiella variicola]PXM53490.1 hypothetical protein DMS91_23210 [Klebsiella variicola]QNF09182.1 toll/interleukin-1 receptor domain-containing protein [Klebsiella variicola]HBT4717390.1 toll/interleukin-1 receptor domain-containing protein [Klebsiella quasipneumoniae subsp. quasipneumoniae]HBV2378263.1 toll/interleukin-1 receptor domain-containing protein [Klebsiella quasipneumoniae]